MRARVRQVVGIAFSNRLGPGIRVASLPELGPGGSWSTCMQARPGPQSCAGGRDGSESDDPSQMIRVR